MDARVVVAVISAVVAIAVAVWTAWWTHRSAVRLAAVEADLARQAEERTRAVEAKAVLDRYRKPLIAAADDLRGRISNIRSKGFLAYLAQDGHPGRIALRATLYRVAAYLGWVEALSRQVTFLHFDTDRETKEAAAALALVGRTLATDRYDRVDDRSLLVLWKEEQRAIGGLMLLGPDAPGVIGFEVFDEQYDERFARWFETFVADLSHPGAAGSKRLELLERYLRDLVSLLDEEGLYATQAQQSP